MVDSSAAAAVKAYFNVFNAYVASMNERLDSFRSLSVELDKQWEERGGPTQGISGAEALLDRMAEVKRAVESLELACGEEVLYDVSHENAVALLSAEQGEIFERMPARDKYDLLIENYVEKYRQEKLVENDAVNVRFKSAQEDNAQMHRKRAGANALAVSDDDVRFAGEQVEVYRRYLWNDSLVNADCRNEAQAVMPIHHPDITNNAIEAEREEHRNLSGEEAADAYLALLRRYVRDYTHHEIWEWRDARNDVVNAYNAFREQGLSKPSFLGNLVSGGAADKDWRRVGNELLRKARDCSGEFDDIDEARHEACSGGYNEEAVEYAEDNIRIVYPELYEKVHEHIEEVWQENNAERLESERQRIAEGKDQSDSHDLSR